MTIARFTKENMAALRAKQNRMEEETPPEKPAPKLSKSQRVTKVDIGPRVELDLNSPAVRQFVESAPDGLLAKQARVEEEQAAGDGKKRAANGRVLRGRRVVITLALKPELLEEVDARAKALGQNRSEFLSLVIRKELLKPEAPFNMS